MAWPTLADDHPLLQLAARLPALILAAQGHSTVWGISLAPSPAASTAPGGSALGQPPFATLLVLQKFLRAHKGDVDQAAVALGKTLDWRREFGLDRKDPEREKAVRDLKFDGLGYVTRLGTENEGEIVCTWNIYGAANSNLKGVFGDLDAFLKWRVDLMERSIAAILAPVLQANTPEQEAARAPISDFGKGADPYQGYQVHDYLNVSMLRMDPDVKAASKKTIELMSAHYPEWLCRKFFVSVPLVMSWVFQAMRLIVSAETTRKFTVVSYKSNLAGEFGPSVKREDVPREYGGTSDKSLNQLSLQ
ncbi:Sfh5p [Rhodotorula paludigena]|uniref:Sfh5p n=1 Tax=Rhodotorula paludigena TaxID=86838 RepID=UPI0031763ACA